MTVSYTHLDVYKRQRTYSMTGDMLTIRDARGKDMTIVNDATGRETSRTDQDGETTTTSYLSLIHI